MWEAHCRVGPFPVPKQGLDAIRKLRELRKIHELCWDKTNPEYKELSKKDLLWKIMDQRANASADLARVLQIQKQVAEEMRQNAQKREEEQTNFLRKKWAFYEGLAAKVKAGKDVELEKKIEILKTELKNKAGDEKATQRLERKIKHADHDVRQMRSAGRFVAKRDAKQAEVDAQYKKDLAAFNREVAALEKKGKTEEAEMLRQQKPEKPVSEYYFRPVPMCFKSLDASFSVDGIQCDWADLMDAEYAAGQWPETVTHSTLLKSEGTLRILTGEEYRDQIRQDKERIETETQSILETIKRDAENARRAAAGLPPLEIKKEEPAEEPKTGLAKYTSWVKNPFKRAPA